MMFLFGVVVGFVLAFWLAGPIHAFINWLERIGSKRQKNG